MKFKLRTLLIFLVVSFANCQRLTGDENQKRLWECGKEMPHESDANISSFTPAANSWITRVVLYNDKNEAHPEFTLGSFISPRHVLTSSQVVLDYLVVYHWGGSVSEIVAAGLKKFQVPLEDAPTWKLKIQQRNDDGGFTEHLVKKAWVLDFNYVRFTPPRSQMLIELSENVKEVNYACLPKWMDELFNQEKVHTFGFKADRTSQELDHRIMTVIRPKGDDSPWIRVNKSTVDLGGGGPMVRYDQRPVTVVGVSTSGHEKKGKSGESLFFKVYDGIDQICELAGICNVERLPITTTTTRIPIINTTTTTEPNGHHTTDLYSLICLIITSVFF